MKKQLEINIETHRVTVIHLPASQSYEGWCGDCGAVVELITVESAALAAGMSTRALYQLVEAGQLHSSESSAGLLRLCGPFVRQTLFNQVVNSGQEKLIVGSALTEEHSQ